MNRNSGPYISDKYVIEFQKGNSGIIILDESTYKCNKCGFDAKLLHWQCPGCKHWDTTVPRLAATKWS